MEQNKEQITLEEKIKSIRNLWLSGYIVITIVIVSVLLLSYTNIITVFNSEKIGQTGTTTGSITESITGTVPKPTTTIIIDYSTPLLLGLTILAIIFGVTRKGRAVQTEKVLDQFFKRLEITRTGNGKGTFFMESNEYLELEWLDRGYFKIIYKSEDIFYAKSGELYWKLLLIMYTINIGEVGVKKEIQT